MSVSKRSFLVGTVAIGLGSTASGLAHAQAGEVIGGLANNEGLFVDLKEFKIHKGRAGNNPAGQLAKADAREVSEGAIIVRSGGKLYIVDAKPPGSTPQAMKDFWESMPLPMR
ncbi:MAG: hypothetical protein K2X43_08935 [Hyphomonadaceae bacterium]|jgi:hypothetical protein|nr:hypothetical protein [Hyphomonadaceae bacterium]